MGKRSRDKGAEAERAAAAILAAIHPDAKRRVSGEEGQGEALGRDLKGTPGLCVQVKEMGAPSPLAAYEQARAAALPGEMPVAFVRQARRGHSTPFRVVLSVPDFIRLLAQSEAERFVASAHLAQLADADSAMKARIG